MVLCDNVFCSNETIEFEYVTLAGRRFCCVACAEDWYQQNEVLAESTIPAEKTASPDKKSAQTDTRPRPVPIA